MNILELDTYDLGDAVKFNDQLNPRLFGPDEQLRPEVREQLMAIAEDFQQFLGVKDLELKDITVSGSNAAYTYTPHSDIDLHLVVDLPEADASEVYRELFDAKKYAYNDQHNIKIGGYDVELYVQDANKTHHSQGIYSVFRNDWVAVPKRRRPDVDDISVKSKFEDLGHRIEDIIATGDYEKISAMADKIKTYRQAGLDAHGEFGSENLAFKILRKQGLIEKLYAARNAAKDELLSLDERKKKRKKKVRYGYGGYWYPGTAYAGQDHPAGAEGGDGGGDGGGESIKESVETTDEDILRDFIRFCVKELKIEQMPRVKLRKDPQWSQVHKTFGRYDDNAKTLEVAWGQRHIMDVLRTVAHELTHKHQHEREGDRMGPDAGETGSPYENEANARAGVLMRDYGRLHPEYFSVGQVHGLEEGASGYIPTKKQAKDPRFSMALTVDIKPGQVGKEANKLKLRTNRQGAPQIARADGLFEELMLEFQLAKEGIDAPISKTKDQEQYYKFIVAKAKMGRPLTRGEQDYVKMYQMYRQEKLAEGAADHVRMVMSRAADIMKQRGFRAVGQLSDRDLEQIARETDATPHDVSIILNIDHAHEQAVAEFAPTPDRDDNDDVPDQLVVLANRWWNATDKQPQIEHVLNSLGWSIHQVESEDDAVQLQHRDGTTYFISADDFDPDLFEISDKQRQDYLQRAGQQVDRRLERMSKVRDRLNKGYEIYHAQDPTRIVHRFEADTPQEARRYYEHYNADYDSDRDYDLRLRRSTGIMEGSPPPGLVVKKGGDWSSYPGGFQINAFLPNDKHVGMMVVYPRDDGQWIGEHLVVDPEYQRQGIGTALWDFAERTVGGRVIAINTTPVGKKFQRSRKQVVAESKIKLSTDPNWYGAEVGDYTASGPVVNVPADRLVGFEPDDKMDQPASKANIKKIVVALKQGAKLPPLLVRKYKNGYQVLDGHHRFWAYKLLGIKAIPAQVVPDEDIKELVESEELDEVKMSPGALEKFATSDAAKGIRAGFEAELIFRDTQGESDEEDPEPDYDADERAYSIQQVIDFFSNDEYGYGLSDRDQDRLMDDLDQSKMNWYDKQVTEDFDNEAEDLVREVWLEERPMGERVLAYLTDALDMTDEEAERILRLGTDAPRFNSTSEQEGYAAENPDYETYLEAVEAAETILDEDVETSIRKQDGYYDSALDNFRDNYSPDNDNWLSDVGLRWMSDIANEYGLDWPVWNMSDGGNSGSRDWDEIGAELQQVVGMPVKVSSNYHSTPRKEGQWIIEPDGSLSPDDRSEEAGLEIVSPPMPLLMAIEKLRQVTDWANDPNGGNAYTNSSTGLHMGVSLPIRGGDVDYVKLILFMGDKYVLDTFGREANNFTASALSKLQQNIKGGKSDPAGVIKLLKHGLTELAYKELQKGVGTSKYTSAHLQNGYIEFRSPGGDWLAKADEEIGVLENTMMRFARAMQIAGDPSADRQEYAKKLYKLVTADNEQYTDQLRLFSEFSAGTINKEQLKKRWAEKTIGTEKKANQRWKLYQKVNDTWTAVPGQEYNGYTEDEAKNKVWSKYGREALDSGEYQLVNMGEQSWEVYDVKTNKTLEVIKGKSKGEVADAVYDKYVDQGIGFNVRPYEDPATMTPRAKLAKRITTKKPEPKQVVNQATNERGVPYWEVYEIENDWNVIHTFLSDTAADAKVDGANWLTSIGAEQPDLFAVRAKMIPNPQTTDNKKDSADIQRRLGVQDVDTDVAQNFNQPQDATQRSGSWAIYDVTLGREISRMDNVPWQQASDRADELERSTGHNMSVRGLSESIDPISGAGAVPPRQDPKNTGKKNVTPAEKVFKNPVKGQPYRSAIGQAIGKKDLENMTQQIQMARQLGDSVMEMEDTPPEVVKALDQAAQKNGYRNWADVKTNPRSNSAVMTVAKLATTMLKAPGPRREKLFYKNKTDVDENFADGKVKGKAELEEGWKSALAGAALAGSLAMTPQAAKASADQPVQSAPVAQQSAKNSFAETLKDLASVGVIFIPGIGPVIKAYQLAKSGVEIANAVNEYKKATDKFDAALARQRSAPNINMTDATEEEKEEFLKNAQLIDLDDISTGTPTPGLQQFMAPVSENFADGKVKGKSRPGRVKRAGASCDGSVTDLRRRAKNASGEKAKMYHWCANMKSGKKK